MAFPGWDRLLDLAGWRHDTTSHREKLISAVGATIALLLVYWVTHLGLVGEGALWVTGSMGASAVLAFAMPHGVLSQPWSVIGGHTLSATFGVACLLWFPAGPWVAAFAVGGAIILMMYCRCLHPPGGATAMIAVLGGPEIEAAGFGFVLYPVLLDTIIIVMAAIAYNSFFEWRRYPVALSRFQIARPPGIAPEDLQHALKQMESFGDVDFEELLRVVDLAAQHARSDGVAEQDLEPEGFYSNGLPGESWAVRQIIQITPGWGGRSGWIRYRVIKGVGEGGTGICKTSYFLHWARYRVAPIGDGWERLRSQDRATPTKV